MELSRATQRLAGAQKGDGLGLGRTAAGTTPATGAAAVRGPRRCHSIAILGEMEPLLMENGVEFFGRPRSASKQRQQQQQQQRHQRQQLQQKQLPLPQNVLCARALNKQAFGRQGLHKQGPGKQGLHTQARRVLTAPSAALGPAVLRSYAVDGRAQPGVQISQPASQLCMQSADRH
ncbi:hypothetical protein H4R18_001740 [Coemansia javaensis]|uniref:Uncharacterized protein n=1 Tax=Coemansia javaensis TaxID=2761396 RepID=A0A9W8LL39_9FUNG|nr:hypothetical protein H4R18_001740 [Coemansia javaensis]